MDFLLPDIVFFGMGEKGGILLLLLLLLLAVIVLSSCVSASSPRPSFGFPDSSGKNTFLVAHSPRREPHL
jgi:hypothetical protein